MSTMAKTGVWKGLAGLLGRAPAASASTTDDDTVTGGGGGDNIDDGDEDEDDTVDGGEGTDTIAGSEGDDDDAGAHESNDGGEGQGGGQSPTGANTNSPDFRAGEAAANTRWATVLMSEAARNNLEMATDLMAKGMSASDVVEMCETHGGSKGGKNAAQQLLERTPKPNLGAGGDGGEQNADAGKAARDAAAKSVNRTLSAPKGAATRRASTNRNRPAAAAAE
jgi:hypothetical protein